MITNKMKLNKKAFTLIELMIVVAIIGIIASIAVPVYQNYTRTTKANTALMESVPYKTEVVICYQTVGAISPCSQGNHGISIPNIGSYIDRIDPNGIIYINMGDLDGINGAEVVSMTPVVSNGVLVRWNLSDIGGTACASNWLTC
jgi:prepilin-type N-terminal cleavage/methylation domain-containing protein